MSPRLASPPLERAICSNAFSSKVYLFFKPFSLVNALASNSITSSSFNGFKGKTKDLLMRAELIETDGFSVVAATNVTQPSSTPAKRESC